MWNVVAQPHQRQHVRANRIVCDVVVDDDEYLCYVETRSTLGGTGVRFAFFVSLLMFVLFVSAQADDNDGSVVTQV